MTGEIFVVYTRLGMRSLFVHRERMITSYSRYTNEIIDSMSYELNRGRSVMLIVEPDDQTWSFAGFRRLYPGRFGMVITPWPMNDSIIASSGKLVRAEIRRLRKNMNRRKVKVNDSF